MKFRFLDLKKRENMTYCSAHRLFVNVIDHVDSFNENKCTNELDFVLCINVIYPKSSQVQENLKTYFGFGKFLILSSSNHSE